MTDTATIVAAAKLAGNEFGGTDIGVHNAGVYPNVRIEDVTDEQWDEVFAAADMALFMTGSTLLLDAGETI